ncbi:putative Response regulator protein (CheY-like protein) [Desulfamplus magnetovallimortis]|uniref:Putative Response regulator protein (CheY-like protein) n=1 Tax=Desulfamplus magnetovallimortis TaxID=1246637 RepID=A0A1W1H6J7_9BACT|nr:response regulator [Desulfamplus magnetovallimortis]SLM28067.1 putative Response regulator protein (CheY-like protein) [Desulfamplus magnetovallimortis]
MTGKVHRIIVINSEPEENAFLQTFLENRGFEVFASLSVCQGIEQLEHFKPELLIVDALSSGEKTAGEKMTTTESSLKRLFAQKRVKDIPVIFISTIPLKTLTFRRKKFYRELCSGKREKILFLEKPLQEDELLNSICILTNHYP